MSASDLFIRSEWHGPRLRVGIVAEEGRLPAYARSIVQDLLRADFIDAACWLVSHQSLAKTSQISIGTLLFRLHELLVEPQYAIEPDPLAVVDWESLSDQFGRTILLPPAGWTDGESSMSAAAAIRDMCLDVIVDFTARGIGRSLSLVPSLGLWRYHFGDSRRYPAGSGYWREIVDNESLCGIELRQIGGTPDTDRVLSRALFSTTPFPSRLTNRLAPIWGATHFVVQNLWEIQRSRAIGVRIRTRSGGLGPLMQPRSRMPDNRDMVRWLIREGRRRSIRQLRRQAKIRTRWSIAVRKTAVPLFLEVNPAKLDSFCWLDSPAGHSWADPSFLENGGQLWMFFEDHDTDHGRGVISCGTLDRHGRLEGVATALVRDYHLSYPQLIAHDGEIFMVPESAQSGSVELYRARSFPYDWVLETRLLKLACVDSTVFYDQGTWWMLTSPVLFRGHAPITWLLSSQRLSGPWKLAPAGPVAMSASYARGAGSVFRREGRLIRPSQDCSVAYGRALMFNEITSLDESSYVEKPIARVEGTGIPGLIGVHTYCTAGGWEAIDGLMELGR